MKIQLDIILTLIVFIVVTAVTYNVIAAGALALGFAKGWDYMADKRRKKAEMEESKKQDIMVKSLQ